MATERVTIRSAIREWWINDVNKPSWFRDDQNERLIDRVIDALDAAAAVRAEVVDIDIDEASRRLCSWLGYAWDGLRDDGRITDHGYPPWHIPTVGGRAFQGRKEDIRDIVSAIVAAAERKEVMPPGQEAVSTEPIPPSDTAPPAAGPSPAEGAPVGWKLVPIQPTEEMVDAGDYVCQRYCNLGSQVGGIWQEMLAATPSPQPSPAAPAVAGLIKKMRLTVEQLRRGGVGFAAAMNLLESGSDALATQAEKIALVTKERDRAKWVHQIALESLHTMERDRDAIVTERDDARAAQAAVLSTEHRLAGHFRAQLAETGAALAAKEAEIEAQRDNIRMLEGALIDKNLRIAELEAALRPFADFGSRVSSVESGPYRLTFIFQGKALEFTDFQRAHLSFHSTLAGKEPRG